MCGISRSTTLVVAYLMTVADISWQDALRCIKYNRSSANPNLGFQSQLQKYQETQLTPERKRVRERFPRYDPLKDQLLLNRSLKAYQKYCKNMDENIFPVPPAGKRRYSWAVGKDGSQVEGMDASLSTFKTLQKAAASSSEKRNISALSLSSIVPKLSVNDADQPKQPVNLVTSQNRSEGQKSPDQMSVKSSDVSRTSQASSSSCSHPESENQNWDRIKREEIVSQSSLTTSEIRHDDNLRTHFGSLSLSRPPVDALSVHSDILPLTSFALSLTSSPSTGSHRNQKYQSAVSRSRKQSSPLDFGACNSLDLSPGEFYQPFTEENYRRSLKRINSGEYYDDSGWHYVGGGSSRNVSRQHPAPYRKSMSYGESYEYQRRQYQLSKNVPQVQDEDYDAEIDEPEVRPRSRTMRSRHHLDLYPSERCYPSSTPSSPRFRTDDAMSRHSRDKYVSEASFPSSAFRYYEPTNYTRHESEERTRHESEERNVARAMYSRRERDFYRSGRHAHLSQEDDFCLDSSTSRSVHSLSNSRHSVNY